MDTEKIKQMGRDYFTANPERAMIYLNDRAFAGLRGSDAYGYLAIGLWEAGWKEARYAASKEGRAIELLGRLFKDVPRGFFNGPQAYHDTEKFLQEIGWNPKP